MSERHRVIINRLILNTHLSIASQHTYQCKIWCLRWYCHWNVSGLWQDLDKLGQPLNDVRKASFSGWSIKYMLSCLFLFDGRAHYFPQEIYFGSIPGNFYWQVHPSLSCCKNWLLKLTAAPYFREHLSAQRGSFARRCVEDWGWGRKPRVASDWLLMER